MSGKWNAPSVSTVMCWVFRLILLMGGMAYFSIGDEPEKVSLMLHHTSEPEPADHGIGLDFRVNDIEAMVSALREAGVLIVQDPIEREWGVKEAVIADPDGYKLWVIEPINE